MSKTELLVLCRHPEILATVVRLVNNNPEWNATGLGEPEAAVEAFKNTDIHYGLVLLGSGFADAEEQVLIQALRHLRPGVPVIKHYGGGSGLLSAEIYAGLAPNTGYEE